MKKIFTFAALALAFTASASAKLYSFPENTDFTNTYAAVYNKDGELVRVIKAEQSDGILDCGDDAAAVRLISPDARLIPGTEEITDEPTIAPTPEAQTKYLYEQWFDKALYEKDTYAQNAPALVKKVRQTLSSAGDTVYEVTLLIGATEQEFVFDEDFIIGKAADAHSDAEGQNASYLKAGDVIILSFPFRDEPRDMCLLYRPTTSEPLKSGEFLPLYTREGLAGGVWSVGTAREVGYSFGIVTKVKNRYFTLCDENGRRIDDISFKENAAVYTYDVTDKTSAEISGTGAICESEISSDLIDDNGNILSWEEDCTRIYALVRTIGSVAADIILYEYE